MIHSSVLSSFSETVVCKHIFLMMSEEWKSICSLDWKAVFLYSKPYLEPLSREEHGSRLEQFHIQLLLDCLINKSSKQNNFKWVNFTWSDCILFKQSRAWNNTNLTTMKWNMFDVIHALLKISGKTQLRGLGKYLPVLQWVNTERVLESASCFWSKLAPWCPIALLEATSSSSMISAASM